MMKKISLLFLILNFSNLYSDQKKNSRAQKALKARMEAIAIHQLIQRQMRIIDVAKKIARDLTGSENVFTRISQFYDDFDHDYNIQIVSGQEGDTVIEVVRRALDQNIEIRNPRDLIRFVPLRIDLFE